MNKPISLPVLVGTLSTIVIADNDPILVKNIIIYNSHNSNTRVTLNYITGIGSSFTFYNDQINSKQNVYLTNLLVVNPYDQIQATADASDVVSIISHTVIL